MATSYQAEASGDAEATERIHGVSHITDPKALIQAYEDWAGNFNKDVSREHVQYEAPASLAREVDLLHSGVADKQSIRVLDVAAGTGLAGVGLKKLGYNNVDALDASQGMLNEAKKAGIYVNYYCEFFGAKDTAIADNQYDVVITTGSFIPYHLDETCYEELIRVTKPGGHIIIVIGQKYFKDYSSYTDKLECRMSELVESGMWKLKEKKTLPAYYMGLGAVCFVLEK